MVVKEKTDFKDLVEVGSKISNKEKPVLSLCFGKGLITNKFHMKE